MSCDQIIGVFTLSGAAQNGQCMTSKYRESDKRADGSYAFELRTLMSYTDHSVHRRFKLNVPNPRASGNIGTT